MDPADLLSPTGRAVVAEALAEWDEAGADPLRVAGRLRSRLGQVPADLLAAAMTQARLRHRARARLGPAADDLFLTADGLEQATRPAVAARRADRLVALGFDHVIDLGAGLGLDSRAFAAAGLRVDAIESDGPTATFLSANTAGLNGAVAVHRDDVTTGSWRSLLTERSACFVDPARRAGGRRLHDPESWSPRWTWLAELGRDWPATVAKLAPGIDRDLPPVGAGIAWTSLDGDLLEAAVWWPALAGPHRRTAVVIRGSTVATLADSSNKPVTTGPIGSYLLEPDDAVIRSGLVGEFATIVGGHLLDPRVAYVTTDHDPVPAVALGRYWQVEAALPFAIKQVRRLLDEQGVERLVIKKRAFAADPEHIARSLHRVGGPGAHTLFLTRIGDRPWAILCGPAADTASETEEASAAGDDVDR